MAETTTVTSASDGTVNITVEKYHDLLAKAAEKPPVIHRTVHKTPEVMAKENVAWGVTFVALGLSFVSVGVFRCKVGLNQMKNIKS